MTRERKDSKIEVRLPGNEKNAFLEACSRNKESASSVLRHFIKRYVHRRLWAPHSSFRRYPVTAILAGALMLAGSVSLASYFVPTPATSQSNPQFVKLFDYFDENKDEEMTFAEYSIVFPIMDSEDRRINEELFAHWDSDQSGVVEKSEWIADWIRNAELDFHRLDTNNDSVLEIEEVLPQPEDRDNPGRRGALVAWSGAVDGTAFRQGKSNEDAQAWGISDWYFGKTETVPEAYLARVGQVFRDRDIDNDGHITREEYIYH